LLFWYFKPLSPAIGAIASQKPVHPEFKDLGRSPNYVVEMQPAGVAGLQVTPPGFGAFVVSEAYLEEIRIGLSKDVDCHFYLALPCRA
jgi:hypothetical protein